jgi:hypothetical protein
MALLILIALLWVIVLAPGFIKRRSERQSVGSIDHFHHQLHLLERTGPKIVPAAYRLQTAEPATAMTVGASGYPAISSSPRRPNLVLLKPVTEAEVTEGDEEIVDDATGGHYLRVGPPELAMDAQSGEGASRIRLADPERYRRQQARRRRRDIVALMLGTTVVTGLLGIAPSLHVLWAITVLGALALGAYIGLAVYALRTGLPTPGARRGRGGEHAPRHAEHGWPAGYDEGYASYDEDGYGDAYEYEEPVRRVASR